MSNSIRGKTAKRVTRIKRPYLGRGKESAPKNSEELFPQVTPAGELTAVERSLPSGSTEPLRIFALFPHLPIDHRFTHMLLTDVPCLLHVCKESRYEALKKLYPRHAISESVFVKRLRSMSLFASLRP
ncbi:hypothetical protein OIDMADRAFT_51653 [Oidiodendron maius Zn]|uniref:Uncharacterized protein n=1 Tax=Oidiodendron maius (strain Zn) TaxID=913774 RepID=A0A0C3H6B5_OIDMZ|nr:hypothetical protein OIDMADRAFT_51653 [Oidiodendron maius Zn]